MPPRAAIKKAPKAKASKAKNTSKAPKMKRAATKRKQRDEDDDDDDDDYEYEEDEEQEEAEIKEEEEAAMAETSKPAPKRARKKQEAEVATSSALAAFQSSARPPACISLATAEAQHLSATEREKWASDLGGQSAARRGAEFDVLRHVGSATLDLSVSAGKEAQLAKVLGLLKRGCTPRPSDVKWGWNRRVGGVAPPSSPPLEVWERTSGEVLGQGFVSAADLLKALFDGTLLCDQSWAVELLEAVGIFSQPDPGLWGCPLIRCIIVPPAVLPTAGGKAKSGGGKKAAAEAAVPSAKALGKRPVSSRAAAQKRGTKSDDTPDAAVADAPEGVLRLQVHVYISRLLLYMIAHPSTRVLLTHLTPPRDATPRPVDALPEYPATFRSHGGAGATPFSLEGLLKSTEHVGYRAQPQPAGLALTLKPYQQQALGWMLDMESLPRGINGLFWEERPFADGGSFYYSPQLGEMRLAEPPLMHGGLLCDEVRVIAATISSRPSDTRPHPSDTPVPIPAALPARLGRACLLTQRCDGRSKTTARAADGAWQDSGDRRPRCIEPRVTH